MSTRPDNIKVFDYSIVDKQGREDSRFAFVEEHEHGYLTEYSIGSQGNNLTALLIVCPYITELLGSDIYEGHSEGETIVVYDRYEDGEFECTEATWADMFEEGDHSKEFARLQYSIAATFDDVDDSERVDIAAKYKHQH